MGTPAGRVQDQDQDQDDEQEIVRSPPLPIIVTSQSFAKPNPTVQRMTSNYKNWLAWASDNLLFIFLILILVLDSSSWCTYGGFRTWGGEQGGLSPQDPDPKSFHRTIWPFLWPNW